jgi:hypothetical protein
MREVHNPSAEFYFCELCPYSSPRKYAVKRHVNYVHNPNPRLYSCPHCDFKAKQMCNMKQHIASRHR